MHLSNWFSIRPFADILVWPVQDISITREHVKIFASLHFVCGCWLWSRWFPFSFSPESTNMDIARSCSRMNRWISTVVVTLWMILYFSYIQTSVGNISHLLAAINEIGCIEDYLPLDYLYQPEASDIMYNYLDYVSLVDVTSVNRAFSLTNRRSRLFQDPITGSGSLQYNGKFTEKSLEMEHEDNGFALCKHPDIPSLHIWLIWNFVIGYVSIGCSKDGYPA